MSHRRHRPYGNRGRGRGYSSGRGHRKYVRHESGYGPVSSHSQGMRYEPFPQGKYARRSRDEDCRSSLDRHGQREEREVHLQEESALRSQSDLHEDKYKGFDDTVAEKLYDKLLDLQNDLLGLGNSIKDDGETVEGAAVHISHAIAAAAKGNNLQKRKFMENAYQNVKKAEVDLQELIVKLRVTTVAFGKKLGK